MFIKQQYRNQYTAFTELFLTGAAMLRRLRIDNADEVDDYADAVFVHKGPN